MPEWPAVDLSQAKAADQGKAVQAQRFVSVKIDNQDTTSAVCSKFEGTFQREHRLNSEAYLVKLFQHHQISRAELKLLASC